MLLKITRIVMSGRWLFLVLWIGVAVGITFVAPNLSDEANKSQQTANVQADDEASKASNLIAQEFPQNQKVTNDSVTVTLYRKGGLTEADSNYGNALEQFLNTKRDAIKLKSVTSPFSNPQLSTLLISKDKQAALMSLDLNITASTDNSAKWLVEINKIIPQVRNYLSLQSSQRAGAPARPAGLQVHLTGGNAVYQEVIKVQSDSLSLTLIMTIVFILVVLLIIYRSPIAAVFPLISVVLALVISQGVIAFAAKAGLSVTPAITEFLVVLLFGAGTDYCLLIVSRFRENLLNGHDKKEALLIAVPNAGEAIVSSACAVIIAFICMGFAKSFVFRALGPGIAIAVFIELVVIMTLIPAIISVLGEKIFWPFLPSKARARRLRREREGYKARTVRFAIFSLSAVISLGKEGEEHKTNTSVWENIAVAVTTKPMRYILCTLVVLVPFIVVLQTFNYDNDELAAALPKSTDSAQGLDVIANHFGQGAGSGNAVTIIVKSNEDIWSSQNLRTIEQLCQNLDKIKGVSQTTTATRPLGQKLTLQTLQEEAQLFAPADGSSQAPNVSNLPNANDFSIFALPGDVLQQYPALKPYMQQYISNDGHGILLNVTLKYAPYSNDAIATIADIRNAVKFTLQGTDLKNATAYAGGVTAQVKDVLDTQRNDFVFIVIAVLSAIYVILALLLGSLVAPLYMVGSIVLSFASTMGIVFVIFKYGFGYVGVLSTTPIYGFVILVALGVDYNIFLMARIKEEHYAHKKSTNTAVVNGLATTGSIITSCGIIMAGTFSAFLLSPIKTFLEMGFAIVLGLILDTFVIRTLLVPAIVMKVGELNWWPRKKIRITSEERTKKVTSGKKLVDGKQVTDGEQVTREEQVTDGQQVTSKLSLESVSIGDKHAKFDIQEL